jgi:hypothetical protein
MPANLEDMLDGSAPANPPDVSAPPEPKVEQAQQPTAPASGTPTDGPQTPSLPANLLSRAQAAGLKLDGIDSLDRFAEYALDQYERSRPYAEYGRSALSQGNDPRNGVPEQGAEDHSDYEGAPEFDIDGHFSGLWQAPQLDSAAQYAIQAGIVQLGEDGLYEAVPGREALALPVLNSLNQAHVAQKQQVQKLFEGNFYKNIYDAHQPAIEHLVNQRINQVLQERFQERDHQGFEEKFIEQHKSWLYGPDGRSFTADGQKFVDTVAQLRESGINDPQKLADWAMKLAGINTQPQQPTQPTNGQPAPGGDKPRDDQGRFIKGAGTPPVAAAPTKQESFLDEARRKAGMSTTQGGYVTADSAVVANDGELDNLWTAEWKRHTAGAAA